MKPLINPKMLVLVIVILVATPSLLFAEPLDYEEIAEQMEKMNEKGQYHELIDTYEKFSKDSHNKSALFWNELGGAFSESGYFNKAFDSFKNATKYDSDNIAYWRNLAMASKKVKNYSQAAKAYQRLAQLYPPDSIKRERAKKAFEKYQKRSDE